jgi:hypothetical protein
VQWAAAVKSIVLRKDSLTDVAQLHQDRFDAVLSLLQTPQRARIWLPIRQLNRRIQGVASTWMQSVPL